MTGGARAQPSGSVTYRRDVPLAVEDVARVFVASGIRRPADDLERIARILERADAAFVVRRRR